MKGHYLLIISLTFFFACKNPKSEESNSINEIEAQNLDSNIVADKDQSFEEFYENFISDSTFQVNHIRFPLEGKYSGHDDTREWNLEKWPLMTWNYKDELNNPDDSVSVIQTDSTFYFGTFCKGCGFSFWMQFEKLEGIWQLTSRQENNY